VISPLNQLDAKSWLKHTISYFTVPNTEPGWQTKVEHPATYPVALAERFIRFFTKPGDAVLDPFSGSGSSVIAAVKTGRRGTGVELYQNWIDLAEEIIHKEHYPENQKGLDEFFETGVPLRQDWSGAEFVCGDALSVLKEFCTTGRKFSYAVFSPPYANALSLSDGGVLTRQKQREADGKALDYGDDERDIGKFDIDDWQLYIYKIAAGLRDVINGYCTVVIQNIVTKHGVLPLAFQLVDQFEAAGWTLIMDQIWIQKHKAGRIHGWPSRPMQSNHHVYCLSWRKKNDR
jgi:DNA modification methylase